MHALEDSLAFISAHPSDAAPTQEMQTPQGMSNSEVLQLKGAGISDQVIIEAINSAGNVRFELDAPHLIELNKAGLSDSVIQAMLRRSKPQ